MNKEEIIEGNKIIAEFERLRKESELRRGKVVYLLNGGTTPFDEDCLLYHKNWNWLMPIVEKISKIKDVEVFIRYWYDSEFDNVKSCMIQIPNKESYRDFETGYYDEDIFRISALLDTQIESVWHCVVGFIKWYNDSSITKI